EGGQVGVIARRMEQHLDSEFPGVTLVIMTTSKHDWIVSIGSIFWCALMVLAVATDVGAENSGSVDREITALLPAADEDVFLTIAWHTQLMQARAEAARLKRPLFLWVMNGHPLGCT